MSGTAAQPQAGTRNTDDPAQLQMQQQRTLQQQQPQQQQSPAAPPPLRLPLPSGRPPLPRSVPASATSSRASSPRSGLSAQSSLHTLNMNRQAQYRRALRLRRRCIAAAKRRAHLLFQPCPARSCGSPCPLPPRGLPPCCSRLARVQAGRAAAQGAFHWRCGGAAHAGKWGRQRMHWCLLTS